MKISINELRSLVRQAVATQIMESAPKKKPTNKTLTAESKKISVNELRSMIKEAIMNEIEGTNELSVAKAIRNALVGIPKKMKKDENLEDIKQKIKSKFTDSIFDLYIKDLKNKKLVNNSEDNLKILENLLGDIYDGNKESLKDIQAQYPTLKFASVVNFLKSIEKDWIPGSEKLKASQEPEESSVNKTEPVYQSGEITYQQIADELGVSKQAAEQIVKEAEKKLARNISILEKGVKDPQKIRQLTKALKKGNFTLKNIKDLIEATAKAAEKLKELVSEKIEEFIENFNTSMIQITDLAVEDHASLTAEEKEKLKDQIKNWLINTKEIREPTPEEINLMFNLLDYSKLEANKEKLIKDFFNSDSNSKGLSAMLRMEISDLFDPETRGRGGLDADAESELRKLNIIS